jgi:transcriptional regulator GlxA family with amidase domain
MLAGFYPRWAFLPLTVSTSLSDHVGMHTEILIYDRFEELDAIGPYDVLQRAGFDVAYVTAEPTDRIEASRGTIVVPHRQLSEQVELLIVPGGPFTSRPRRGTWAEVQRGALAPAIAARHAAGATVASVCTGAFLLAAGGLLDGRPATTHHENLDELEGKAAQVIRDARVVDDGDVITSAGVTAGIDMALWLAEKHKGPEAADRIAAGMEHRRDRAVWQAVRS